MRCLILSNHWRTLRLHWPAEVSMSFMIFPADAEDARPTIR